MSNDPSTPSGSPGDDGLPPEIMRIFRDLNGGRDLPPQLVEQLRAMGIADADIQQWVADVSAESGEFIEIVNYNLAGSQYALAGTVAGLRAALGERIGDHGARWRRLRR